MMIVSKRNIAALAAIGVMSSTAALAQNCCNGNLNGSGFTNIPVVSGGSGCCGTVTGQIVAVPGVYVPGSNVSVGVGGANIGGSAYSVGGSYVGGSNTFIGGNTYASGGGSSFYSSGGNTGSVYYGGGGSYFAPSGVATGMIENLAVGGGEEARTEAVTERRVTTEIVPIRAVCMDDRGMPHPASRPTADEQVAPEFTGEVFRCMAGTHMEVTMGRMVDGRAVFDGGSSLSCAAGQALTYRGGQMVCAAQTPQRNCNERSLLRRFGPGIKYVTLQRVQEFTSQRQTQSAQTATFRSSMFVDGGVGQGVF